MDMKPTVVDINEPVDSCSEIGQVSSVIYIDPEKEAAARRKFDKYVVPVSVIFLVLSTLDRNNVSEALVMKAPCITDSWTSWEMLECSASTKTLGLKGGQFGNINTLSSVCTIIFEVPWVLAVRRFGSKKAIGTSFILWSACTLGTTFIQTDGQAIAVRMLLNAAEAGLAQGFAYLFSTIYPRELAGKRIMTTNLAQCISGVFGGLFAYAIQTMGNRHGFAAWRWLFIVEFLITLFVCGIGMIFLPNEVEEAWFLSEEEKETMRLKKKARLYDSRRREV